MRWTAISTPIAKEFDIAHVGSGRVVERDSKYLMNCVFCPRVTSSKLLGNSTFVEYAEDLLRCSEVVWQVSLDVFDQYCLK